MIKKYRWKCRVLLVKTPDYKNQKYKRAKVLYQKDIKHFHKRIIKLVSKKTDKDFSIELYGFDGAKKQIFKNFDSQKIFKLIDQMPMSKILKNKKMSKSLRLKKAFGVDRSYSQRKTPGLYNSGKVCTTFAQKNKETEIDLTKIVTSLEINNLPKKIRLL